MDAPDECEFARHRKRMSGHWWNDVLQGKIVQIRGAPFKTRNITTGMGEILRIDGERLGSSANA
jgi:hypothetical protein